MQDGAGGDIHLLLSILADGEEQVRQLDARLGEPDALQSRAEEYCRGAARQLQCTFGKAIAVAKAIEAAGASGSRGTDRSESPRSADESFGRTARDIAHERQDMCKRRKGLPRWTEKFRVPDANLEATPDDGFSWRKYGQKDILGAKFPRGYYRCTYRNAQGCPATKQVQRSDSDLSLFDVTYQGVHACHQKQRHATASPPGAVAAHDGNQPPPLPDPNLELLASFKNGLKVETEGQTLPASFHDHDHDATTPASTASFSFSSVPFHGAIVRAPDSAIVRAPYSAAVAFSPVESGQLRGPGFSPAFVSPAASAGSSYFSMAHCPVGSYDRGGVGMRGAESELGETASAVDPAGFDYSLYHHHAELDPHLPFAPMFGGHTSHGEDFGSVSPCLEFHKNQFNSRSQ